MHGEFVAVRGPGVEMRDEAHEAARARSERYEAMLRAGATATRGCSRRYQGTPRIHVTDTYVGVGGSLRPSDVHTSTPISM